MGAGRAGEITTGLLLLGSVPVLAFTDVMILQLYHTKLEQLSVLVSRLATYADVLETHFMGPDVLALTTSGLRAEGDEEFVDVSADRFFRLEKELVRAKAEVVRPSRLQYSKSFTV